MMAETDTLPQMNPYDSTHVGSHHRTQTDNSMKAQKTDRSPYEEIPFFPKVTAQAAMGIVSESGQHTVNVHPKNGDTLNSSHLVQIEKLKNGVRERDVLLHRLKHENMLLNQIERRQQKEIENMEIEHEDAPRTIKGLKDELNGLKMKLKDYFAAALASERKVRIQDDQIRKLKEQSGHFEDLVKGQELEVRKNLTKDLTETNTKLAELEQFNQEARRKSELQAKNFYNESKSLRSKIHSVGVESESLRNKATKLDEVIKEKDREIASLSIYRYNALHRKPEVVCKTCQKREKVEAERRRKQDLIDNLPILKSPTLELCSSSSVLVTYMQPPRSESHDYNSLKLVYSSSSKLENVTEIVLPVPEVKRQKRISPFASPRSSVTNISDPDVEKHQLVESLESGQTYFFWLLSGVEGLSGLPTAPQSILVDIKPNEPPKPVLRVNMDPASVAVHFLSATPNGGSPILNYRLFMQVTDDSGDVIKDTHVDEVFLAELGKDVQSYQYAKVELTREYKFRIKTINGAGESPYSQWSEGCMIDIAPGKPSRPQVRKLAQTSVKLTTELLKHGGSDITGYRLVYCKVRAIERPKPKAACSDTAEVIKQDEVKESQIQPVPLSQKKYKRNIKDNKKEDDKFSSSVAMAFLDSKVDMQEPPKEAEKPFVPQKFEVCLSKDAVVITEVNDKCILEYSIGKLEPGVVYVFSMSASNKMGESEVSEWSEEIDLDNLIPPAAAPNVTALSATSIRVSFADLAKYGLGPKITGHCISAIKIPTVATGFQDSIRPATGFLNSQWRVLRDFVKAEEREVEITGLDFAESYWIRVVLVGEGEHGETSAPAFVPLAAALPLPRSPIASIVNSPIGSRRSSQISLHNLSRHNSRGGLASKLNRHERFQNMHDGHASDKQASGSLSNVAFLHTERLSDSEYHLSLSRRSELGKPPLAPRKGGISPSSPIRKAAGLVKSNSTRR